MPGFRAEIQPELWAADPHGAVRFYEAAFGAKVEHLVEGPGGDDLIAALAVGAARFWVSSAAEEMGRLAPSASGAATARLLLVVDDPASVLSRASGLGAEMLSPLTDEHGWRLARLRDPAGHEWEIGHPLGPWPPSGA